ncbi:hypothetical protein CAOG_009957 [Capsaspora owczarzaki ATCC 30864]|uniref:Secreted protein n=1 Tax=Capsaspora owczarzaki (strain ATCC 30864) TaxID=595528 RepID=A0A0D2VW48_CAPO3|nr:hypothetical protein CAOG_009957 [Capsaspora owczarzaki ATCC 30864]
MCYTMTLRSFLSLFALSFALFPPSPLPPKIQSLWRSTAERASPPPFDIHRTTARSLALFTLFKSAMIDYHKFATLHKSTSHHPRHPPHCPHPTLALCVCVFVFALLDFPDLA